MMQSTIRQRVPQPLIPIARQIRRQGIRLIGTVAYRGDTVECVCCGWTGNSFLPHYGRRNAACPKCGSVERYRVLALYLDHTYGTSADPMRALHIAPEPIISGKLRDLAGDGYIATDLNSRSVPYNMDITDLLFRDDLFDIIICSHVLEHVPDERAALHELWRTLAPGGSALIMVPVYDIPDTFEDPAITSPEERQRAYGQYDHVRKYGHDVVSRLAAPGWTVTPIEPDTFGEAAVRRYGLVSQDGVARETIYRCTK